jgi:hypothetical protein
MEGIIKKEQEHLENEGIKKFHRTHPGWSLLQVARCPAPGCGRFLYCKKHRYAYRKWWINLNIGLK